MANETAILAAFAADLRFEDLPPAVVERAKLLTLDLLGSAVRARVEADSTPAIFAALRQLDLLGEGRCTVMGDKQGYGPVLAALLNGVLGHSLDFDDTHAESSLHPSAPVAPAALAVGERFGLSGEAVLTAIVAGYEVCCRIGNALNPTAHYARGFHPTATAGVFGGAAAVGKLMGVDTAGMISAFGVAGSHASGSLQFLVNGAWNKRWQVGVAARDGVLAGTLAANGFVGAIEALEGKHGFLKGYSDGADPARVVQGLGTEWETMRIGVKPYPSCRYSHAALDGLIALRREHDLAANDIERVEIGLHRNGITLTASPLEAKRRPANVVEGQFSMPFTAAVALDQGSFGWDDYRRLGEPAIEAMAQRIDVRQDDRVEAASPHPFGARVALFTRKGMFERAMTDPSGEPESFPDEAAFLRKFNTLAEPVLGANAARLAEAILGLEKLPDLAALRAGRG